ncbi:hypothetical protein H2198_002335 [Neophaeococcomyces mojaviensis]|uniref:Uncharacterized protein n=1 Tax=Neophaeococcomyces mojaviensis TaxID=3383035 RepID=A0ACC3AEF6_9EURO|nr:hypothetical protein H2198_002335 [Knufia sp. JES_112]
MTDSDTTASHQSLQKTKLIFQLPEHQSTTKHDTKITATCKLSSLSTPDQSLLKIAESEDLSTIFVLTFESTIFHPQGGGQPSDVGHISLVNDDSSTGKVFEVLHVRHSIANTGVVLHFGRFVGDAVNTDVASGLELGKPCTQLVDADKRLLFSRYHTAGHVLGTATRMLLEDKIEGFDELKASHFPDSASCEFKGLIEGKWKGDIQSAVDDLVVKDAEVKIEWWTKRDFIEKKLERLLPSDEVWKELGEHVDIDGKPVQREDEGTETRIRMVNIVGAEVYPCGGTHVPSTKGCGKVGVRKISRQKGNSRVSYNVD